MDTFVDQVWPWLWPSLALAVWCASLLWAWRRMRRAEARREDGPEGEPTTGLHPKLSRALKVALSVGFLLGVAAWLMLAPLPGVADTVIATAWPWLWISLAIVAGVEVVASGLSWLADFCRPHLTRRSQDNRVVGAVVRVERLDPLLRGLKWLAYAALAVVWLMQVPLPELVTGFVTGKVWPWLWPLLAAYAVLTAILLSAGPLLRRATRWTRVDKDDPEGAGDTDLQANLLNALRRPMWALALIVAGRIWAHLVPLPDGLRNYVVIATAGAGLFIVVIFINAAVQAWMQQRQLHSTMLKTSGGVLRAGAKVVIYILGGLMVLSTLGIDITPLIASLGVGSLAVGLALQKTLEDFFAGLILAADQPIRVGDFVAIEPGFEGTVLTIGWRSTQIRTREDMYVFVPNSKLAGATLLNRSRPSELVTFTVPVGIAYGTDLDRAAAVTAEVAQAVMKEHAFGVDSYVTTVAFTGFGDSSVDFVTWLRASNWNGHFGLKDLFVRRLHARFQQEDIVIPFPIRTLDLPEGTRIEVATAAETANAA